MQHHPIFFFLLFLTTAITRVQLVAAADDFSESYELPDDTSSTPDVEVALPTEYPLVFFPGQSLVAATSPPAEQNSAPSTTTSPASLAASTASDSILSKDSSTSDASTSTTPSASSRPEDLSPPLDDDLDEMVLPSAAPVAADTKPSDSSAQRGLGVGAVFVRAAGAAVAVAAAF